MLRSVLTLTAVVLAGVVAGRFTAVAQTPAPLNPVGSYGVSTLTDVGVPISGTLNIRAASGNYTGEFVSDAATIPVRQVATSATHVMAVLDLGESLAFAWTERQPDGTFTGTWHALMPGVNVKLTKNR